MSNRRGAVYFAPVETTPSMVKIGFSEDRAMRMMSIRTWCPVPIKMAAEIPAFWWNEQQVHCFLYDDWSHGEWFFLTPKVTAVMDGLLNGSLSFSDLTTRYAPLPKYLSALRIYEDEDWEFRHLRNQMSSYEPAALLAEKIPEFATYIRLSRAKRAERLERLRLIAAKRGLQP